MKVVSIRRYPVKSMMGEELNACDLTDQGIYGDRMYGVVDSETGKLANAKNPKKWPTMFQHRSTYTRPVKRTDKLPPVQITMPNGKVIQSDDSTIHAQLSKSFNRTVTLQSPSIAPIEFEGYVPEEIKELDERGTVFSRQSPSETFFDLAHIHIITTNTIDTLSKLTPSSRIEARRFRPNIIIDVPEVDGFIEEKWIGKTIQLGDEVQLQIIQPTKRCVMTTLAQGDLPDDLTILKTLVKENSGNFGVYAEIKQTGHLKVGDNIQIY